MSLSKRAKICVVVSPLLPLLMISQPVASRRRLAKHWLLRRGNPFTILFPIHTILFFMLYSILTMGEDVNQTHEKRDAPFVVSFFVS